MIFKIIRENEILETPLLTRLSLHFIRERELTYPIPNIYGNSKNFYMYSCHQTKPSYCTGGGCVTFLHLTTVLQLLPIVEKGGNFSFFVILDLSSNLFCFSACALYPQLQDILTKMCSSKDPRLSYFDKETNKVQVSQIYWAVQPLQSHCQKLET